MGSPVVRFEIGCRDRKKTAEFYGNLFGWSPKPDTNQFSNDVVAGNKGIPGAYTALGHEPHNFVMIYVEVEDVAKAVERTRQLGVVTPEESAEVPQAAHHPADEREAQAALKALPAEVGVSEGIKLALKALNK